MQTLQTTAEGADLWTANVEFPLVQRWRQIKQLGFSLGTDTVFCNFSREKFGRGQTQGVGDPATQRMQLVSAGLHDHLEERVRVP